MEIVNFDGLRPSIRTTMKGEKASGVFLVLLSTFI